VAAPVASVNTTTPSPLAGPTTVFSPAMVGPSTGTFTSTSVLFRHGYTRLSVPPVPDVALGSHAMRVSAAQPPPVVAVAVAVGVGVGVALAPGPHATHANTAATATTDAHEECVMV